MNNDNREWLSALTDGELHGKELEQGIDALRNDSQLQASWMAYHVIRDSVSSNLDQQVAPQLHRRIAAALEAEPTILAPQRRQRAWVKQAAGVAIAASVTGIAIVGVQQMNMADSAPKVQPVAQQQEYIRMQPTLVAAEKAKPAGNNTALDRYLVNHNEYSANAGIQGVLPYVRIVGYKANK